MEGCRIIIAGRVQGVFYRKSTQVVARELGLKGYAQNLPDGRVLIEAEGGRAQLEELVRWCEDGPPASKVTGIEIDWCDPSGHDDFHIRV